MNAKAYEIGEKDPP